MVVVEEDDDLLMELSTSDCSSVDEVYGYVEPLLPFDISLQAQHTQLTPIVTVIQDHEDKEFFCIPEHEEALPRLAADHSRPRKKRQKVGEHTCASTATKRSATKSRASSQAKSTRKANKHPQVVTPPPHPPMMHFRPVTSAMYPPSFSPQQAYYQTLTNLAQRMRQTDESRKSVVRHRQVHSKLYQTPQLPKNSFFTGSRTASEYQKSRTNVLTFIRRAMVEPPTTYISPPSTSPSP